MQDGVTPLCVAEVNNYLEVVHVIEAELHRREARPSRSRTLSSIAIGAHTSRYAFVQAVYITHTS